MAHIVKRTVCPHDCPDACGILASVDEESGQLLHVRGAPDHPFTRGVLCGKVAHYEKRVYAPGRLLHPLRRTGPKGSGQFELVSWEDALQGIAGKLGQIIREYGGEAVLPYWYAGTMGIIQQDAGMPFFHAIGASRLDRTICSAAADAGWMATCGNTQGTDPETVVDSDFVVIWGMNAASTNMHFFSLARQAQKKGARLVVIDPWRTRTAKAADWHMAPKPGTDTALALGVMHVLVRDGLVNDDYLRRMTSGYEILKEEALPEWTPQETERITGVPAEEITALAHAYGKAEAPFLRIGVGISRHPNGAMMVRTIACLPALVGAFEKKGGGLLLFTGGFPVMRHHMQRRDLLKTRTRIINMVQLGQALTQLTDPPVKALLVYASNPANVAPDQMRVHQGLKRDDLFTVVHEQFLTDTARYADYVLPATTSVEHADLYRSYGHYYMQWAHPVIKPLGEAWSNWRFFRTLARKMGFNDPMFDQTEEELLQGLVKKSPAGLTEEEWESLWAGKPVRVGVRPEENPFQNGFGTPSRKLEFYSTHWEQMGLPGLPTYIPYEPYGACENESLHLLTAPAHFLLNTSFDEVEDLRDREKGPSLLIHPRDAGERGLEDGQVVVAYNRLGESRFTLRVTEDVLLGTAVAAGVWREQDHGQGFNVNALTSQRLTDVGGGATFYGNLVKVRGIK